MLFNTLPELFYKGYLVIDTVAQKTIQPWGAQLTQSVEHVTFELGIVSLSPPLDIKIN